MRKLLMDQLDNWKSSLQLLHHEVAYTETILGLQKNSLGKSLQLLWEKLRNIITAKVTATKRSFNHQIEHYVLLPTVGDRLQLLHEQLWRNKFHVAFTLLFLALLQR